jgi:hypothetical protein
MTKNSSIYDLIKMLEVKSYFDLSVSEKKRVDEVLKRMLKHGLLFHINTNNFFFNLHFCNFKLFKLKPLKDLIVFNSNWFLQPQYEGMGTYTKDRNESLAVRKVHPILSL